MPNLCYSSPFSTTKPTCEAAKVESGKGNMRMKRVTQASSVSGLVHAQMRYHHVKFLIERDKNMERENALLEEKEEAKQSERTTLLDMLETKSLLHMQKANVNLHRLLLSRRDGTWTSYYDNINYYRV